MTPKYTTKGIPSVKPILFSTEMVRAILEGRKTQTRRIVKPIGKQSEWLSKELLNEVKNGEFISGGWQMYHPKGEGKSPLGWIKSKYQIGDTMWVRETFAPINYGPGRVRYAFKADDSLIKNEFKWKPSIFMPKEGCRLFLEVTHVRLERVQDISEEDAISEGVEPIGFDKKTQRVTRYRGYPKDEGYFLSAKQSFKALWQSINGKDSWEENPYVFVYDFGLTERPLDFIK